MIRMIAVSVMAAFLIAGCVNPTVSTVKDTRVAPTYSAPKPKAIPEQIKKDPDAYKGADSGRTYSLTLKNADIKDVLMLLSKESGVPIVQDRNLRGLVKIEAQNKKLGELLFIILKPLGYTATVENGAIIVGRPQLETRTFRVNYLKDKRNSSSNMNVSGFSAGSVSVTSTGQSDFWGALENSLEMLVFGTNGKGKRDGGGFSISEGEKKADVKLSGSQSQNRSKNKTENSAPIDVEDPLLPSTQISEGQLKQLVVNEIAGIVQVTDLPENIDRISSFLHDVEEGSKRQVMIQAHIMEVSLKDSYSMGIDWKYIINQFPTAMSVGSSLIPSVVGGATSASAFKFQASRYDFDLLLDAMKEQGNVNMLSSPKITALNNQKAVIKLTTKQVSWVSSKTTQNNAIGGQDTYTTTPQVDEVGIFLDVTPQIGQDNSITMQIHPSVSEIKEISTSPDKTSTKPIIDVREIDTMVDARAGETIVIAGLISDKLNETKRSVPLLGDIPYLGALFSYNKQERTKAELVIMMTPYILNSKTIDEIRVEHEQRLKNMTGSFHLINNMGGMITESSTRNFMSSFPTIPAPDHTTSRALTTTTEAVALDQAVKNIAETAKVEKNDLPLSKAKQLPGRPIIPPDTIANPPQENQKIEKPRRQKIEQPTINTPELPKIEPLPELQDRAKKQSDTVIEPRSEKIAKTESEAIGPVGVTSVTSNSEQTLYRQGVAAYKSGNCSEAVKQLSGFIASYPNSPFAGDAAIYRSDCMAKM